MDRIIKGAPWTFNNHLLVFQKLFEGEDLLKIPLVFVFFLSSDSRSPTGFFLKLLLDSWGTLLGAF